MIYKELKLQEALSDLLQNMHLIPAEDQKEDDFFYNIYWKAQLYSFFDADIWIGVSDEEIIRRKISEKISQIKTRLEILLQIESIADNRKRLKNIIKILNNFDVSNGFLTDVILRIKQLNQDFKLR
jgi:hypothetical protein